MGRLEGIEGLRCARPDGAFYALPDVSAFFGAGVEAHGFGPVPDADALCRRAAPAPTCMHPMHAPVMMVTPCTLADPAPASGWAWSCPIRHALWPGLAFEMSTSAAVTP